MNAIHCSVLSGCGGRLPVQEALEKELMILANEEGRSQKVGGTDVV